MSAKTVAIWGKNGCGKTTLAVNLAAWLAQNQKLVGLVSASPYAEIPAYIDCTFPANKGTKAAKEMTSDHIKNFFVEAGSNYGFYLLSVPPNDSSLELSSFDRATGRRIIQESREVFDVVIFDGMPIKTDAITGEAVALCDVIVIPVDDNIAYPQWYQSSKEMFDNLKVKCFFFESKFNGYANIQAIFKSMGVQSAGSIQYVRDAQKLMNEGTMLFKNGREGRMYESCLAKMWEVVGNDN